MFSLNRIVLVGRLTKDPRVTNGANDSVICSFSIAVDDRPSKRNDDQGQQTSFFNCVSFGQTAQNVAKFVKTGSLVAVDGRMVQRTFVDSDGKKTYRYEVRCDVVQFLEPKRTEVANEEPEIPTGGEELISNDDGNSNLDNLDMLDS